MIGARQRAFVMIRAGPGTLHVDFGVQLVVLPAQVPHFDAHGFVEQFESSTIANRFGSHAALRSSRTVAVSSMILWLARSSRAVSVATLSSDSYSTRRTAARSSRRSAAYRAKGSQSSRSNSSS